MNIRILLICFLLGCFGTAQIQAQPKLTVKSPIVQLFMKKLMEEYISKQVGENKPVKDLAFIKIKEMGDITKLKGSVIFANPKAALGNGDYRFKMKIGTNLLKPQLHMLKLQVARLWFIRFYVKVYPR